MERFRTLPKATIAVIEGTARGGGCEFAMAFDMRYAALGTTVLGHPEVAVGIIPGGGGTQRLPRLVGRGRALEVILGCRDIDAETAEAWGYVNRALPADELRRFVDKLATRIASCPLTAISAAKRAVDVALDEQTDLTTGLRVEDQLMREALAQPVARERLQAILDAGAQTREFELGEIQTSAQDQRVAVRADVDRHHVAVVHLAGQQHLGQLVADGLLDQPAQRTRAVERVEPAVGQPLLGGQRHLEGEPPLGQPLVQLLQLDVDDLAPAPRG